ncbi:MAG: hypothetical protein SF182_18500 [Deltaproteobacteria bacterium]|nr:hypothetical protein [Deltaproteobacteria bacterium]
MSLRAARYAGVAIGVVAVLVAVPCDAGDDAPSSPVPALGDAARLDLLSARPYRARDFGNAAFAHRRGDVAPAPRARLDLSPLAANVLGLFREHGLPLREQRDAEGHGPIGVTASINVGRQLPAVSFHLGDRPVEPLGAFYSGERGFRCALVWPIERLTLRLEGGEDSEFGYYGIVGVQWLDRARRLAVGAGIPLNLRDAEGDVGVIVQLRLRLD